MLRKFRVYLHFFLIVFLGSLNFSQSVNAVDTFEYKKEKFVENKMQKNIVSDYIFGPGDKLKINVYKMKDFDAETKILPDGTINLPRI